MPQNLPIVLFQHSHESPQLFPRNPPIMLVLKIYDIVTNIHFNACYFVTLELFQYNPVVLVPGGH